MRTRSGWSASGRMRNLDCEVGMAPGPDIGIVGAGMEAEFSYYAMTVET